jgi:hypothetical protein
MLKIISTVIFLCFVIPMSINMILFIQSNRKMMLDAEEQQKARVLNKRRIITVVILFISLPIVMFLLFLMNHLFSK